ncbi:MAG: SDR family NAD(P)-dependent oxidoreductase [Pseudomonadota bacterium]
MARIALVTGANQGLGLALAEGLARRLGADDVVYLTARDLQRGRAALAALPATPAEIRVEQLDVTDPGSIETLAQTLERRHGGVDLVASNAAARLSRDATPAEQVRGFIETNNHGSRRLLGRFWPLLRANARWLIVASSFGRASLLPEALRPMFDTDRLGLDEIEASMDAYVNAVERGGAEAQGWPDWINVPSKIGQVATARVAARLIEAERPGDGILINAACPGLVDTDASRPWFEDMSKARSPAEAAIPLLDLLMAPAGDVAPQGELMREGAALPWLD